MTQEELNAVIKQIPYWKSIIDEDCTITIISEEKVEYVDHAEGFHMNNEVGSAPPSTDLVWDAIRTKKERNYDLPKEVFGVSIHGKYTPYFSENGEFLCIIATAFSMERQMALEASAESISSSLEETSATITTYNDQVEDLFKSVNELTEAIEEVEGDMKAVAKLVAEIKGNAAKSKILALNATIEAARSGEAGRGFAIVAEQMGALASSSNTSSGEIDSAISGMFSRLSAVSQEIRAIDETVTSQAEAIKGITAAIEVITDESQTMFDLTSNK